MKNLVEQRKEQKRNQILSLIRHSRMPLSRFDVKKSTQYSMTTVINTINDLIHQRLLLEDTCAENNRMGRKPTFLHLNPDGGYFIGIEFNIQHMYCIILDFAGNVIYSTSCSTLNNSRTEHFILQLKEQIQTCITFLGNRRTGLMGIGLGLPGYIDMDHGIALHYAYIKDWINIPIVQMIKDAFSIPCYIGNNVSSMCLAFKWLNQYRQDKDFVFVSVRTGVRSILFINGEPYLGKNCSSGELGHIKLNGCLKTCTCGQTGCLNTEVSVLALEKKIRNGIQNGAFQNIFCMAGRDITKITVDLLTRAALEGDREAIALIQETSGYLGQSLATIVNLIAPPDIIITGPLCKAGDLFLMPLLDTVNGLSVPENLSHVNISLSPYGDDIGAIGAAALILEEKFNTVFSES